MAPSRQPKSKTSPKPKPSDTAKIPSPEPETKRRGRGRPRVEINEQQLETLARFGCTQAEISEILGVSPDTLQRNFAAILKKGAAHLKFSLRRAQIKSALGGNVTAQIWTGKNYLGQRSVPQPESGSSQVAAFVEQMKKRYTQIQMEKREREAAAHQDKKS